VLRFVETECNESTFPRFFVFNEDESRRVRSSWTDASAGGTSNVAVGGCCTWWNSITVVHGIFATRAVTIVAETIDHLIRRRRKVAKVSLPGEERDRRKRVRHFDSGAGRLRRWFRRGDRACSFAKRIHPTSVVTGIVCRRVLVRRARCTDRGRCKLLLPVRCENAAASTASTSVVGSDFSCRATGRP
jgi:hypothetical protein